MIDHVARSKFSTASIYLVEATGIIVDWIDPCPAGQRPSSSGAFRPRTYRQFFGNTFIWMTDTPIVHAHLDEAGDGSNSHIVTQATRLHFL
jgi:hypothetical protein